MRQSEQKLSTAAFGFEFPGVPRVIGPFGVFDARLTLSTPLFDARAIGGVRAGRALVKAGQADLRDVRETIVLAVGTLYLQAQADAARVESARAEVTTAEALVGLASDQKTAGIVAGIDVLRQQVQLQSARAAPDRGRERVREAQAVAGAGHRPARRAGVHAGERDGVPRGAAADARSGRRRGQRRRARTSKRRRRASTRRGSRGRPRPRRAGRACTSTPISARSAATRRRSIAPTASRRLVRVPVFEGGETRARVQRAQTELRIREAELADLTGSIRYDVSAALLDVRAADAGVEVADSARTLSQQELDQARDRFRAGVASTLELVQAQESVATATEQYIDSLYAHAVAKGTLTPRARTGRIAVRRTRRRRAVMATDVTAAREMTDAPAPADTDETGGVGRSRASARSSRSAWSSSLAAGRLLRLAHAVAARRHRRRPGERPRQPGRDAGRRHGPVAIKVQDNQAVKAGTVLVELDPRDYQLAVAKAEADLAAAEAAFRAASSDVPVTSSSARSGAAGGAGRHRQRRRRADRGDRAKSRRRAPRSPRPRRGSLEAKARAVRASPGPRAPDAARREGRDPAPAARRRHRRQAGGRRRRRVGGGGRPRGHRQPAGRRLAAAAGRGRRRAVAGPGARRGDRAAADRDDRGAGLRRQRAGAAGARGARTRPG